MSKTPVVSQRLAAAEKDLDNPEVNMSGDEEGALARTVAALVRSEGSYMVKRSNLRRGGYRVRKFKDLKEACAYAEGARASGCVVELRDTQGNLLKF